MIGSIPERQIEQIVQDYLAGDGVISICRRYKRSPNTVYSLLRRKGVMRSRKEAAMLRIDMYERRKDPTPEEIEQRKQEVRRRKGHLVDAVED